MGKSVIIIPARLSATRLPRKPLLKINNIPMVIHTMRSAKKSNIGNVIVATPDKEIFDLVEKYSGKAMMTRKNHLSGTDRVAEVITKLSDKDIKICINLQVDLPNLNFQDIIKLNYLMQKHKSEIGTLASSIENTDELKNKNIVKNSSNINVIPKYKPKKFSLDNEHVGDMASSIASFLWRIGFRLEEE